MAKGRKGYKMRVKKLNWKSFTVGTKQSWRADGVHPVDYYVVKLDDGSFYARHGLITAGSWRAQAVDLETIQQICQEHHESEIARRFFEEEL